jgi:hypothetical protein
MKCVWGRVDGRAYLSRSVFVIHLPGVLDVSVGSFIFPWPQAQAGIGTSEESLVTLRQPIGSRSVIDGNTGDTVRQVQCPWSLATQGKCGGQSSAP